MLRIVESVVRLVHEVLPELRLEIAQRRIHVVGDVVAPQHRVEGDPVRLLRALLDHALEDLVGNLVLEASCESRITQKKSCL